MLDMFLISKKEFKEIYVNRRDDIIEMVQDSDELDTDKSYYTGMLMGFDMVGDIIKLLETKEMTRIYKSVIRGETNEI